jgi:hypothetical protein
LTAALVVETRIHRQSFACENLKSADISFGVKKCEGNHRTGLRFNR